MYKRQEILLAQISNDPKLAGKPEPVKVKTVSYTHLDVYKRQVYSDGGDTIYVMDQVGETGCEENWISSIQFRDTCLLYTS